MLFHRVGIVMYALHHSPTMRERGATVLATLSRGQALNRDFRTRRVAALGGAWSCRERRVVTRAASISGHNEGGGPNQASEEKF